MLGQQFFGQSSIYWLSDPSLYLKKSHLLKLKKFLENYSGPHKILLFAGQESPFLGLEKYQNIQLPDKLIKKERDDLLKFFVPELLKKKVDLFFKSSQKISLDLFWQGLKVVPIVSAGKSPSSLTCCNDEEVNDDLKLLSDLFFSKKKKEFFLLWVSLSNRYSPAFWSKFWSNQIWKAYIVVDLLEKRKFSAAKYASFTLPSAFISSYAFYFSLSDLASLHKIAYALDCAVKLGSSFFIDVLFNLHFKNC